MPLTRRLPVPALAAALLPGAAQAHGLALDGHLPEAPTLLNALLLALAWAGWGFGARRVPPRRGERLALHAAAGLSALALFGPFDDGAPALGLAPGAALHMAQHMLLMVVIAPLWVIARPLPQWRALLGARADPLWKAALRPARSPMACAVLHGAAVWAWHAPAVYDLAVTGPWWHLAEHACFLFTAWLFWWSVLRAPARRQAQALFALLFTLMHTGMLGALLSFARAPFYLDAPDLADQQLAGLLMWVPGGLAYVGAAAGCGWRWFSRLEARGLRPAPGPHRKPNLERHS
ncbi:cytochrome c oxidase assembly protein [Caldimonas tepidiphila]|uniref:cytochrome c oxidase assembly protein n=1 Tax=Caldimonas tepidiphila TaxID=2315841 RepID=UPI000E5AE28E|nr:cytochrome c oxidase assembly protein [Caldimonas tepidiphila]